MWNYNHTEALYHHGVKGQKWGVRRYQNQGGSLTPEGRRRQKIIDKELEFQNKKIKNHMSLAKQYRDSANQIRKDGYNLLRKQGYSDKDAKDAVAITVKKRETEALWNEHVANHIKKYNQKLSEVDINSMSRLQIHGYIQTLGNQTLNEINSTWKEP